MIFYKSTDSINSTLPKYFPLEFRALTEKEKQKELEKIRDNPPEWAIELDFNDLAGPYVEILDEE